MKAEPALQPLTHTNRLQARSSPHRPPHLTSWLAHWAGSSRQSAMNSASSAPSMGLYRARPPPGTSIQLLRCKQGKSAGARG